MFSSEGRKKTPERGELTVEPRDSSEDTIVVSTLNDTFPVSPEDLGDFCKTVLAVLGERNLIDDEDD